MSKDTNASKANRQEASIRSLTRSAILGWCVLHLPLAMTAVSAERFEKVEPIECAPRLGDYTFIWWAHGFRGRSPDGRWLRCIQTGHYAMAMDVNTMQLTHFGPIANPLPYEEAVAQNNSVFEKLPGAGRNLTITVNGKEYRCVEGGKHRSHSGPRLIESGRFVQRADVTDLVFRHEDGNKLGVDARLETAAWPDRLTFLLEAQPTREVLKAGESFGRVGGGYCFDGINHIEVPHSPEIEPEKLTLELWVYCPEGPPATRYYPWIVCKNGNEWEEGNYGFALIQNVPVAFLNIGGGRENVHIVSAKKEQNRGPLPNEVLKREQWTHLAMTYDGAVMRLYVNGEERGNKTINKKRVPGAGGLAIGRRQDNAGDGYHFRGVVDEMRIYSRALSAEEIRSHYETPENVKPDASLACEWTFDPKGRAAIERPTQEWRDASMAISLRVGDVTMSDHVAVQPDEVWTYGNTKTAAISLIPTNPKRKATFTADSCKVKATTIPDKQPCSVDYDETYDWYRIDLDGVEPQGKHNDSIERVKVTLANTDAEERVVRLLFDKNGRGMRVRGISPMTGMSPMLRDIDGFPLGVPVQISKNWHGRLDRNLTYQGAWLHAFTMLRLPGRSEAELEFTLAYAHWGGVAAASHAQLCLIGWGTNQLWDESAIGAWGESICYEPDQIQGQCAVLDVRPVMVHRMNSDRPLKWNWTNNVGGADFFRYFAAGGKRQFPARMKTAYRRYCPNLTEVTYAGRSQDAKIEHRATVSIYRTNDITRGVYRLRLDVKKPTDFKRIVFFQVGADTYNYTGERKMAIGDEDGLTREWETQWGGARYKTERMECKGRVPWVSMHEAVSRDKSKCGAWANRGIIIRSWDARLGGRKAAPYAAEYGVKARGADTSLIDIVPPPDVNRLLPGDYVEATFEHIIMPQFARDYYGPNENLRAALKKYGNTWRMIYREAMGNDLTITVSQGTLESIRPTRIRAADDRAQLTISGGLGYAPITFTGLLYYRKPVFAIREGNEQWRKVDQSVHGNDFWQADYDTATQTWDITYSIPLDAPGDVRKTREIRFQIERGE